MSIRLALSTHVQTLKSTQDYLELLESLLRTCPLCGRSFIQKDLFCYSCWNRAVVTYQTDEVKIIKNKFPSYCIFDWNEKTQNFIDPLIHALKGGRRRTLARKIAEQLIQYRMKFELGAEQIILVPAARGHHKNTDHALEITKQLSQLTGFPILDILKKKDKEAQKKKNKKDRALIQIDNTENNTWFPNQDCMYILVDDVITTGSTALSSYIALKQPVYFEVWSICYRPLLARQGEI